MRLALSLVSPQGLWILTDSAAERTVAHRAWTGDESSGLQSELSGELDTLLREAGVSLETLESLHVVTGPGAFTGLRIAAAFAQGLARALGKPLGGIPTFDLFGQRIFLPLQHQKVRRMSVAETLEAKLEWLELRNERDFVVRDADGIMASEAAPYADFVGHRERPFWPAPEELRRGVRASIAKGPRPIEILYGLEPKISGQRTPF